MLLEGKINKLDQIIIKDFCERIGKEDAKASYRYNLSDKGLVSGLYTEILKLNSYGNLIRK